MEAILEKKLEFDKSEWKPVKFGDVVREPKESIKDPEKAGVEYVVGLEHIEPEDIHLRSFNTLEDSTTFTKAFKKGDVLFGRRRAYLKKAALAEFDGICSGDITVFRAKENLLPELLPFIVNNEKFFDWAVKHSAGGLSPRVKFKELAEYEFLLPPKEQQAQLSELLWAMDNIIESSIRIFENSKKSKRSIFNEELYRRVKGIDQIFGKYESKYPVVKLGTLVKKLQYGISESVTEKPDGIPILRMNNLSKGKIEFDDLKYYKPENGELEGFLLQEGDILFNRTNSFDLVGKVSLFKGEGVYSFASYLIRIQIENKILMPEFLNFYLNTAIGLAKIRKFRTPGVSQSNINAQNLKKLDLPLPSIELQMRLMNKINQFELVENIANEKIDHSRALQKNLINQIF